LLDAYVNGVNLVNGFSFWTSGSPAMGMSEYFFFLNGEAGNNNAVAIDNITGATTPEPSSMALLAVAMGAIPVFRRKRKASDVSLSA
jgi:hypothetical protein